MDPDEQDFHRRHSITDGHRLTQVERVEAGIQPLLHAARSGGPGIAVGEAVRAELPEPVDFSMHDAISRMERETDPFTLRTLIDQVNRRFEDKQRAHKPELHEPGPAGFPARKR